ncbi:CbtA family protein [Actinomadura sp. DC4]|uniref:CbtA family protein n=1 Tax=Actinomadura sp. DC4 TaxID=3055069 RepID=UPI0025B0F66B|nr:CbtA family protein [Actinomadura sp. DC4]MDN3358795.1 CbtA family protein [Actinomadura sp. DC4]
MERRFILRGLLVGAIGGVLAFVFARIFAEPQIQAAIDYESGRDAAQAVLDRAAGLPAEAADPDLFSRTIQANVGIGAGIILFGAAMGALYAVAYALACGRTGDVGPRSLALLVALGGFLGFYLLPFLKYPANPPSVGHPETIRDRSGLYLVMVLVSIVFLVLAVWLGQRLSARFGTWNATLLAGLACAVALGIVMLVLPQLGHLHANVEEYGRHSTETPLPLRNAQGQIVYPGFPADLLFKFRLYSVGAQAIMWGAIGLCFAPLAERLLAPKPAQVPVTV